MKPITNAEAIIQGLENINEYEVAISAVHYINCPYTYNPDCKYDGDTNNECCDYCKLEWLKKEFKG